MGTKKTKKTVRAEAPTTRPPAWWYVTLAAAAALVLLLLKGQQRVPEPDAREARDVPSAVPAPVPASPRAEAVFRALVRAHPSKEVRAVEGMLDAGTVRFATSLELPGRQPLQTNDLMYVPGARTIVSSEEFLTGPNIPPCVRTVALRHEVEHLRDDLAGMRMVQLVNDDTTEDEWRDRIRRLMHAEWRADIAQRETETVTRCTYMDLYGKPEAARCAAFRKMLLTDNYHVPTELFGWYPSLRTLVAETDCATLSGPF